jgi:hypothetical protein
MIQERGATTGLRVTPADLDAALDPLVKPQFHVFPGTTVTVCCLRARNGYTVVGHSTAVDERNFDETIGREVAFRDARDKLWPLLGFLRREQLAAEMSRWPVTPPVPE